MADQPEALRLANLIDHGNDSSWIEREAAAELRRLHAVNQELLESLKDLTTAQDLNAYGMALHNARAAIAKAEGQA
jgi:hypothetical protein